MPARASARRFSAAVLRAIAANKYFGIRAGHDDHRFVGIWMVAVDDRVFVRSWNMKARGWHAALSRERRGAAQIGDRIVSFRARTVRGEKLKDAVSAAYFAKYDTPAALAYCRGLARGRRRDSTTELVPE